MEVPAEHLPKEKRIYLLHEELGGALLSRQLAVDGILETDVLIIGSAPLLISRDTLSKVAHSRCRPEEVIRRWGADGLVCRLRRAEGRHDAL